jgi:hypothetical protein
MEYSLLARAQPQETLRAEPFQRRRRFLNRRKLSQWAEMAVNYGSL